MLIRNYRTQRLLLFLATTGLLVLIVGHLVQTPLLNMLDTLSQSLTLAHLPTFLVWLTGLPYFISHGLVALLIFIILLFFLWGFKYKIPATWLGLSLLASQVGLTLLNWVLAGLTQPLPFFNRPVFWLTWLYSCLAIFVLPEIRRWRWRILSQLLLGLSWLAGITHALLTSTGTFTNCLAAWWLALVSLMLAEHWYLKAAPWASRFNGFRNSWY